MHSRMFAWLNWRGRIRDYRVLLAIGLPLVATGFSDVLTGIVDTALIGRYGDGTVPLAAVGIATSVFFAFVIIIIASSIGQQVMTAQAYGAKRLDKVGSILLDSLAIFGAMAVGSVLLCIFGATFIASIFSNDPEVIEQTAVYLRIRGVGILFIVIDLVLVNVYSANKETKWGLYGGIILNVVNIALSYPLIYGFGFFPELGVAGSALGGLAADFAGLLFSVWVFFFRGYYQTIWPKTLEFSKATVKKLVSLGWPTLTSVAMLHVGGFFALVTLGRLGTDELAAGRVALQFIFSAFAMIYGFQHAGQIMAGRLIGAHDWPSARRFYRRNLELGVMIYLPFMVLFLFYPNWIINLFTDQEAIFDLGETPLRIGIVMGIVITWALSSVTFIRGIGKTRWDLAVTIVTILGIFVPLTYVLTFPVGLGIIGVFIAELIFWVGRGAILQSAVLWLFLTKKEIRPIDDSL